MPDTTSPLKPCPKCGSEDVEKLPGTFIGQGKGHCNACEWTELLITWNHRPEEDRLKAKIKDLEWKMHTEYWDKVRADNTKLQAELKKVRESRDHYKTEFFEEQQSLQDAHAEIKQLQADLDQAMYTPIGHPTCETCRHARPYTTSFILCHGGNYRAHKNIRGKEQYCSGHSDLKKKEESCPTSQTKQ